MKALSLVGLTASIAVAVALVAPAYGGPQMNTEVQDTIQLFQKVDPNLKHYFDTCEGYAVFPSIGKGAIGIGMAEGHALVFERGTRTGKAKMTQITLGPQLGGQSYAEVIFFESRKALDDFRAGKFTMSAGLSAVAAASGASMNAKYQHGVLIFTLANNGLMFEASVGGQKFKYTPQPPQSAAAQRSESSWQKPVLGNELSSTSVRNEPAAAATQP